MPFCNFCVILEENAHWFVGHVPILFSNPCDYQAVALLLVARSSTKYIQFVNHKSNTSSHLESSNVNRYSNVIDKQMFR